MPKKSSKTVLPDPLPNGQILQDIAKKKWVLGPSIGIGGFGEIYSAAEHSEGNKKISNFQYVVKIEPHENGPLFCEMHFFKRNAKPDMINTWCTENKISLLGIPRYLGSGSHEHAGKKYRFIVMDKYGKDLWNIFLENKKQFPVSTVYRISLQLLDVLEYIHNNGYVHADIKGANILLGLSKQTQNQVFLVDYGLASRYTKKDFKPDPKKAHNGTIEYTSRDAHEGVPTRRGDIEILAYNMVQWMGTVLPWEKNLSDPVVVYNSKKKYMEDVSGFLNNCFAKKKVPGELKEFVNYVSKMNYDTEPDYKKLRNILTKGIISEGGTLTGTLVFKSGGKHKTEIKTKSGTPEKRARLTPKQNQTKDEPKRGRKPVYEEVEESESEIENTPKKNSRGRKRKEEKLNNSDEEIVGKPATNNFNAEMLRLQKKISERQITKGKTKKSIKESSSSSMNNDIESSFNLEEDVIDGTPPEKLVTRRKRIVNKPVGNEDSEEELTPRTLRLRQRR